MFYNGRLHCMATKVTNTHTKRRKRPCWNWSVHSVTFGENLSRIKEKSVKFWRLFIRRLFFFFLPPAPLLRKRRRPWSPKWTDRGPTLSPTTVATGPTVPSTTTWGATRSPRRWRGWWATRNYCASIETVTFILNTFFFSYTATKL